MSTKGIEENRIPAIHAKGKKACHQVGMYIHHKPSLFESIVAEHITYPDGRAVVVGNLIVCGVCNEPVNVCLAEDNETLFLASE